jgi:HPt (histidine-containing phosphotransfer) domain-containing protein
MITIEKLREFGADVDDGLARCLNKKDFYIDLIKRLTDDKRIYLLDQQIKGMELGEAFETAHTLKGMYANLSITPLTIPCTEMTELLRRRVDTDYTELMEKLKTEFERLCAL